MRPRPRITHTKSAILVMIAKVVQKYKGNWCLATQETFISLLKLHRNVKIARRMLNYHLSDLRDQGLIKTIKRTKRNADGTLCLLSSATCITIKGCYVLARGGYSWAYKHAKKLRKKYFAIVTSKNINDKHKNINENDSVRLNYNPFKDPAFRKATGIDKIIFDTS